MVDTGDAPGAEDVLTAAAASRAALGGEPDRDWTVRIPDLDWTVGDVVAHMLGGTLWYAVDLSARGVDLGNITITTDPAADPDVQLDALAAAATMLAAVVEAAPPEARGYHPMGAADRSGFAAMACDEILIHTWDATGALGVRFEPDPDVAARTLRRLFPWVEPTDDPWHALLWSNGRTAWNDHPRQTAWHWHCRPLSEWQA